MRRNSVLLLTFVVMLSACKYRTKNDIDMLKKENLIAWCIVPFDAMERTPEQRAAMLKELGISKLAYDYRDKHIPEFAGEIDVLASEGIELSAVWLWIQAIDEDGVLDAASESIVRIVENKGVETQFWISFPDQFFEGLTDEQKLEKSVFAIGVVNERLKSAGCTIALYNHGSWFGNPLNQIRIIEAVGSDNIGIVYNFHHAHHEIDQFEQLFTKMMPYLTAVNLNGMTKEGPKIITLGEGEEELELIRYMISQGYKGPIGIIGHTDGEDIKVVLERNLNGLKKIAELL